MAGTSGRVRISLIAVAATVALVAVIVPLQAGASNVNPASQLSIGYLTLGFTPGATDITSSGFRFYPKPTSDTSQDTSLGDPLPAYQGFSVSNCNVTTPTSAGPASYAKPSTNYASGTYTGVGALTSNGNIIGLGAKPKNGSGASGTPCGRVDYGESLTISLVGGSLGGVFDKADLDIEAKFGTIVNADLKLGSRTVSSQQFTDTITDSGPNCSGCNNWSFKIDPGLDSTGHPIVFDTIVLSPQIAPGGNQNNVAFTLEGGQGNPCIGSTSDCTGSTDPRASSFLRQQLNTRQSVFHLTSSGALDCGQTTAPVTGSDITTSVDRLNNADGSSCSPVNYSLTTGDHTVSFRKDLSGQPMAQFVLHVTWAPETAVYPITHATQITYDGTSYHTLLWCTGVTYDGSSGKVITAVLPSNESYCLVSHNEQLQSGTGTPASMVVVHEDIYGFGDPGLKR